MQKFVPWSRIGIFRNERTRSTPLNPKLMYWCVSWCLGAFWIVSLLHEARCKIGWSCAINAKVRARKSLRNFSKWTHPIHPIGPWTHVLVRLAVFRCILDFFHYCTNLGAKRAEPVQLMQKFVPQSRIGIFRNQRTRSTPLDPKLMFWCVWYYWVHLGPFFALQH